MSLESISLQENVFIHNILQLPSAGLKTVLLFGFE